MSSGIATRERALEAWDTVRARQQRMERERLRPPRTRLWDGDYQLRGEVAGERAGEFTFEENETGTGMLQLSLTHYLAKWVMNHRGRAKRNVHVTFEKQGARWAGRMENYRVVREKGGDAYLEITFKHDYEELKHIYCWANPFLRAEFQFPKMWVVFGPAKWCLLLTLFVNILRLETSLWTLPDDPMDITEWMGPSFYPGFWRNIVKPFPFFSDNSNLTIIFSRFRSFHDVAKNTLKDAQLTITCRRYFPDEDEHPFAHGAGILWEGDLGKLYELIPLRHGCLVWDIVDNSGWGEETAFGGSLLTGFARAVMTIASDGTTEGIDVFTGDPTYPGEYYVPNWFGTAPRAPWVVFEEGPLTGIESSEFIYYEATDTSILCGGRSMPGVNEAISAGVNFAGDFATSLINSAIAQGGGAAFGTAIDLPPLGGMIDAVLNPVYSDVILAFSETPTARAVGSALPIAGLENVITGLGDFHYYEGWADGADKAFTLSAMLSVRAKLWSTRAHTAHTIEVSDAAPYYIGESGFGHFWLGNRVGTTVLGYPIPFTVFVERVSKLTYKWDKDGPSGWKISIGYREPEDPLMKAFEMIQELNSGLGSMGIL